MPLCTFHLLALNPTPNGTSSFLSAVQSANISPLVLSRVVRWIVLPSTLSTEQLIARNIHWSFLLILTGTDSLPASIQSHVQHHWSITAGVPSRLLQDFGAKNAKLLQPEPGSMPPLKGDLDKASTVASAQNLELSSEIRDWIRTFSSGGGLEARGAVSMLNLLSFRPAKKASYLGYGKAFASSVGKAHGGNAKIVGSVTHTDGVARGEEGEGEGWNEVALAHYPSVEHFAEMLGDEAYQEVNRKYRLPALSDTCILMTSEVDVQLDEGARARL